MVTVTSTGPGTGCLVSDGTRRLWADTTPEKGGEGAGWRPHDLLAAALAGCLVIQLRMFAAQEQIPLTGVVVKVDIDRSVPGRSVFRKDVEFSGDALTVGDRQRLRAMGGGCPVQNTLSARLEFVLADPAGAGQA